MFTRYEHTSLRQHCTNREASSANVKQSTPNASYPQESFFHTAPINNSSSSFSVAENVLNIQKPDFFQENTFKVNCSTCCTIFISYKTT